MKKYDLYENNSSPSYDRLFVPIGHPGRTVAVIRVWREKGTIDWNVGFTDRMYTSDLKAAKEGKLRWLRYVGKVDLEGTIVHCLEQGRNNADKGVSTLEPRATSYEKPLWLSRTLRAQSTAIAWDEHSRQYSGTYAIDGARIDESCNRDRKRLQTPAEWAAIWAQVEGRCRAKLESLK